jgi:exopolysaccharide biosynthesis protein
MAAAEAQGNNPLGFTEASWGTNVVSKEISRYEGVPLALVRGGRPKTVLVAGRESVSDLISNFQGVAGINGGFFVISDIASTDNRMIGPCITSNVAMWMPDLDSGRLTKLINRPLIIISADKLILAPFRSAYNSREEVEQMVGPVTDAFVAGAWLVHKGVPRTREQIMTAATGDAMDFRRRAFLGVTSDGDLVMGACTGSYSSDRLAKAAAAAGCVEAVLLDSGFSTSLVYNNNILASGHSTKAKPSRPVPHAIIVDGVLAGLTSSDEARTPRPEAAN